MAPFISSNTKRVLKILADSDVEMNYRDVNKIYRGCWTTVRQHLRTLNYHGYVKESGEKAGRVAYLITAPGKGLLKEVKE